MTQDKSDFAAKLEAIRLSYVNDGMPEQLRAMEEAGQKFVESQTSEDAMDALVELHAASHKLAGSSGTFGLHELSDVARALSDYTDKKNEITKTHIDEHRAKVRKMLEDVMKAAQAF